MTDELITELGQISELRVISRTSAMNYNGACKPLPQLNVDAVVEGATATTLLKLCHAFARETWGGATSADRKQLR